MQDVTRAYDSSVHRSIKMAPAQVTMSKPNSERMKDEERMKSEKNTFKFKVGDFVRISHARKTFTREYDQRWSGVNCSKLLNEMGRKGIPHTKSKTMPGSPLMEHFMKKSYRRSLQMSIIRWKNFEKSQN